MKTKTKMRLAWVIEALGLLACLGLGVFFFWYRQCQLDLILLVVWGVLLMVMTCALIWAERWAAQRGEKAGRRS